jgi:hypothetical protein
MMAAPLQLRGTARKFPDGQLLVWWEDQEALICRYVRIEP